MTDTGRTKNGSRSWTDADDEALRTGHAAGKALHELASEMGRSKSTVSTHAKRLGIIWDRSRTEAATRAVVVDNRHRRASIVARVYAQAEAELTGLEQAGKGWRTILKGSFGVEEEQTLTFAPPLDRRNVADIINRHLTSAAKLEAIDAGHQAEAAKNLLTGLAAGFGLSDAS